MIGLPFRIASRAPEIAIGTIGTPARIAITNAPLLERQQLARARLRVPSGKTRNEPPAFSRATAVSTACVRLLAVAALDRDEADQVEAEREDRELAQLGLVENVEARRQPAQHDEEDRRFDVAGVVDAVDRRRDRGCARRPRRRSAMPTMASAIADGDEAGLEEQRSAS